MDYFLILAIAGLILLAIIVGILAAMAWRMGKEGSRRRVEGILNPEQIEVRNRNLLRILELFNKYEKLTNSIIRQELGFDDRVTVNYMDELQATKKVLQVGKIGRSSHYILKK